VDYTNINQLNRAKRFTDVQLEDCLLFVDLSKVKISISTEKSKKKNVANKVVKTIHNEWLLHALRDSINLAQERNLKNVFIVAK